MSNRFTCDALRCTASATWHGFGGRSHFCDRHKPEYATEGKRPVGMGMFKSAEELGGLVIRPKPKRGRGRPKG
jgi:hypothetical protein